MAEVRTNKSKFSPMTDQQRKHLFWLFKHYGIDEEARGGMIYEWTDGRASRMSELGFIDAMQIINYLRQLEQTPQTKKRGNEDNLDKKRKGLIRAVFAWYEQQGKVVDMKYVIGTICRAGGVERINDLTETDLQRLYAEFCRKQKAQITINQKQTTTFSNN